MNIELLKNLIDYGVIALLLFMSFISFWFFIERIILDEINDNRINNLYFIVDDSKYSKRESRSNLQLIPNTKFCSM